MIVVFQQFLTMIKAVKIIYNYFTRLHEITHFQIQIQMRFIKKGNLHRTQNILTAYS